MEIPTEVWAGGGLGALFAAALLKLIADHFGAMRADRAAERTESKERTAQIATQTELLRSIDSNTRQTMQAIPAMEARIVAAIDDRPTPVMELPDELRRQRAARRVSSAALRGPVQPRAPTGPKADDEG